MNAWTLVDRKAWDPAWQEVLVFAAGQLAGQRPRPLLEALADAGRDDLFRHRLALAARCLAEVPAQQRARLADLCDRVTEESFGLWWEHRRQGTAEVVGHLGGALPCLRIVNGRVHPAAVRRWLGGSVGQAGLAPLGEALCAALRDGDADVRRATTRALEKFHAAGVRLIPSAGPLG
jgi:hypothetical protein